MSGRILRHHREFPAHPREQNYCKPLLQTIIDQVPDRLRLLIVLAAYVGLREGEALELRRSDVDGVTGRISVTRKIDKDVTPGAAGACPKCGRAISAPKTARGARTVHVPPPFLADAAETPARAHRARADRPALSPATAPTT